MRKNLNLLVVLLGLVAIANAQGTVIKKGKFKNQTAPIPETAGTPINLSVTQSGPPDNSTYSLYYTLERLE